MERRRAIRRVPAQDEPLSAVRMRAGRELTVVNLSDLGALVEGPARLLPGTHVEIHVMTPEGRTLVRSRVTRAYVCHVDAESVRYRGALAFDRPVDTRLVGYAIPDVLADAIEAPGNPYPDRHDAVALDARERLSA